MIISIALLHSVNALETVKMRRSETFNEVTFLVLLMFMMFFSRTAEKASAANYYEMKEIFGVVNLVVLLSHLLFYIVGFLIDLARRAKFRLRRDKILKHYHRNWRKMLHL